MVEIDGVAQCMLLCPPDLNADHLKTLIEDAGMALTVEIKTGSRHIIDYPLSSLLRYGHESLRER